MNPVSIEELLDLIKDKHAYHEKFYNRHMHSFTTMRLAHVCAYLSTLEWVLAVATERDAYEQAKAELDKLKEED